MIIFYNPTTLEIHHLVEFHPPNYTEYLQGQTDVGSWLEWPETIPLQELYLTNGGGSISANRRAPAPNIIPPTSLHVGVEAQFTGIPEGTNIFINGLSYGVMDATSVLDFTPGTAGTYIFRFEKLNAMPKEITLEAVS